jgi:hypothetical protein
MSKFSSKDFNLFCWICIFNFDSRDFGAVIAKS